VGDRHVVGMPWKKNPVNKNQGWEPIRQKCKANVDTSRYNPNKKQKQTINKKIYISGEDTMQREHMITK
jgi:hypothetical protein